MAHISNELIKVYEIKSLVNLNVWKPKKGGEIEKKISSTENNWVIIQQLISDSDAHGVKQVGTLAEWERRLL